MEVAVTTSLRLDAYPLRFRNSHINRKISSFLSIVLWKSITSIARVFCRINPSLP